MTNFQVKANNIKHSEFGIKLGRDKSLCYMAVGCMPCRGRPCVCPFTRIAWGYSGTHKGHPYLIIEHWILIIGCSIPVKPGWIIGYCLGFGYYAAICEK